jgi:hypothetical protein
MRHLLLLAAAALVSALEPAPASFELDNKPVPKAFVLEETIDTIGYTLDAGNIQATVKVPRTRVRKLTYVEPQETNWIAGVLRSGDGKWEAAAEAYAKAAQVTNFGWVREEGRLRAADAWMKAGKPAESVRLLAELEKDAPRSARLPQVWYLRGSAQAAAKDYDAAAKTFAALKGRAKDWGVEAALSGARGEAQVLRQAGKHAEAATIVADVLKGVDPAGQPTLWAELALERVGALAAAGQADEALAQARVVALGPAEAARGRARLEWAKLLATRTDTASTVAAFDQAAIAALLRGTAQTEAAALARKLAEKLGADKSLPPEQQREYKQYTTRF